MFEFFKELTRLFLHDPEFFAVVMIVVVYAGLLVWAITE